MYFTNYILTYLQINSGVALSPSVEELNVLCNTRKKTSKNAEEIALGILHAKHQVLSWTK